MYSQERSGIFLNLYFTNAITLRLFNIFVKYKVVVVTQCFGFFFVSAIEYKKGFYEDMFSKMSFLD